MLFVGAALPTRSEEKCNDGSAPPATRNVRFLDCLRNRPRANLGRNRSRRKARRGSARSPYQPVKTLYLCRGTRGQPPFRRNVIKANEQRASAERRWAQRSPDLTIHNDFDGRHGKGPPASAYRDSRGGTKPASWELPAGNPTYADPLVRRHCSGFRRQPHPFTSRLIAH